MSEPAAVIQRRARKERTSGFEQLREKGIALLQTTSGHRWTDHNLHDPGITMLEVLCFALTELSYRAHQPVEDQLALADGRIDWEALSLHPPQEALTCRATTAEDHRRLLLDRVPGLDDAYLDLVQDPALPLWQLWLKLAARAPESEAERVQMALAVFRSQRGLGEDVQDPPQVFGSRQCELHAEIELTGPRDAAEVLAEVYDLAARLIDRSVPLRTRSELIQAGQSLEQIYDGPRVERGHAPAREDSASDLLYVADVAAQVAAVSGVKDVRKLWLWTEDHRTPVGALHWVKDGAALRLRVPGDRNDTEPSHVHLHRRGHAISVAPAELWHRVQDLQAAARAQRYRQIELTRRDEAAALPKGRARETLAAGDAPYHSVQFHFPAVYGLGLNGVPAEASPVEHARVRQLAAYLALLEQHLANGQAQVEHLRELFTAEAALHDTYWWKPLAQADVPGLDRLWLRSPEELRREVFVPFDRGAPRRHQLLDHLLALHGEQIGQSAMRQFCSHLRGDEQDQLLLQNKAAWLKDVVTLERNRAGGFDYGRALMGRVANTPGLARRACLLLGLRHTHARPLTRGVRLSKRPLDDSAWPGIQDPQLRAPGRAASMGPAAAQAVDPKLAKGIVQAMLPEGTALSAALLRAGCSHTHFRVVGTHSERAELWLGPGEGGRWWRLGHHAEPDLAARVLCQWFRARNDEAEGLHLVEHVLLRPLGAPGAHAALNLPADFFNLRLTAVMPDWTVRTNQPAFQALAEETLQANCPVHLLLRVRWLGFEDMQRFESEWRRWLVLRRRQVRTPGDALLQQLDAASAAVLRWLQPPVAPELVEDDG
jgi:hypothetical protein